MGEFTITIPVEEYKRLISIDFRMKFAKDILDNRQNNLLYKSEFYPVLGWEIPKEEEEE